MARLTKYVLEEMGAKATYSSIATFVRITWQRHTHKLGLGRRPPSPYPCPPTSIEVPSCRRKHVCIDTLQQTAKLPVSRYKRFEQEKRWMFIAGVLT